MKAHFSTTVHTLGQLAAHSGRAAGLALVLSLGISAPAHAVDGCKLLLCMAGDWQHIGECTPTVRQALRDVARGRVWPTCSLVGGSATGNQAVAPEQCPQQYRTTTTNESGQDTLHCSFSGVIHVAVDGQAWSRTWWSASGDSVVEWLPAAKAALAGAPGAMDDRFERDLAAWVARERISEQARQGTDLAATARPRATAAATTAGGGE